MNNELEQFIDIDEIVSILNMTRQNPQITLRMRRHTYHITAESRKQSYAHALPQGSTTTPRLCQQSHNSAPGMHIRMSGLRSYLLAISGMLSKRDMAI